MHFTVLVIGDDVDKIMEPYQENNFGTTKEEYLEEIDDGNGGVYMTNPNSFYDYYSLGGRWRGMILTKSGQDVDQALKEDIDFDTMYAQAEKEAIERYDLAMRIFGDLPIHKTFKEMCKEVAPEERYISNETRAKVREPYLKQPRVVAFATAAEAQDDFRLNADDFLISKEEYINNAKAQRFNTYGFIVEGGEYQTNDHHEEEEYYKLFSKAIEEARDDAKLSILDCHV